MDLETDQYRVETFGDLVCPRCGAGLRDVTPTLRIPKRSLRQVTCHNGDKLMVDSRKEQLSIWGIEQHVEANKALREGK